MAIPLGRVNFVHLAVLSELQIKEISFLVVRSDNRRGGGVNFVHPAVLSELHLKEFWFLAVRNDRQ